MSFKMGFTIGLVSLGCPKNQVDAEILLHKLSSAGFDISNDAGICDVVIINTCGFIEDSKRESIENIMEFVTLKKEGKIKKIVVTGCLAERYKDEIAVEIPEADVILGIGSNDKIVEAITEALNGVEIREFSDKCNLPLNGERIITTLPFFAYLKIAEGCDNCCTYCAIPSIRGGFRSRTIEDVVSEAKTLAKNGVTELVVIAQDTTKYGEDIYGKPRLDNLLEELCKIDGIHWIRLLYAYPDRITDSLLDVMAKQEKIVKYIDLPLQHVNGEILKRMNRQGDKESIKAIIDKIRIIIPNIVIRTTFITGFPGETEEQFTELCEFIKDIKFERLGCFSYSEEEGTPASIYEDQIDIDVRKRRAEVIMDQQMMIMESNNKEKLGCTVECVVEGFDKYAECFFGRSREDAPDIDGKVFFSSTRALSIGEYVDVLIDDTLDYDLIGEVVT